jgi:DnaK suppressor protein
MTSISPKNLEKLKEKLKKDKASIEKELERFAKKDSKPKGEWDTRFPLFDGEVGGSALEKAADETEEYSTLLPIEESLENRLRSLNLALKKMKTGRYGICEKCQKKISLKRLKIYPDAKNCQKCTSKNQQLK